MTMRPPLGELRVALAAFAVLGLVGCGPAPSAPPPIGEAAELNVAVEGRGRVIYGWLPLSCSRDCIWEVPADTQIQVQALPASGQVFVGWGGDCDVLPNPCSAAFSDGDAINATFAPHALRLDLIGRGQGAFAVDGGGVAELCTESCAVALDNPLQLAVTYDPQGSTGTSLGDWSGDCIIETPSYCLVDVSGATELAKVWSYVLRAVDDAYDVASGTELIVAAPGVLANDVAGGGATVSLVYDVEHGELSLAHDGGFRYVPDAGFVGEDGFTYWANDGTSGADEAAVVITVFAPDPTRLSTSALATSDGSLPDEPADGSVSVGKAEANHPRRP